MQINLVPFFNHTIKHNAVMERMNSSEKKILYGVNGIVLTEKFDDEYLLSDIVLSLKGNASHTLDNIVCDGQLIPVFLKNIKFINIVGFTDYGTVLDSISIINYNNEKAEYDFVLKTFHTNSNQSVENNTSRKCISIKKYMGNDGQKHNIYSYNINLEESTDIKEIMLPINLSLHIMSIICA